MPVAVIPPTISFSTGFMAGLPNRILRFNEVPSTQQNPALSGLLMAGQQSYGNPSSSLYLMKGAVPTDFTGIVDFTSRSADVLCTFNVSNGSFAPTQPTVNPAIIATAYQNATASGTATWFWLTTHPTYQYDSPNILIHQAIGTVGVVGSGADVEMASVAITSGQAYRVLNLRILFQSTWTY